MGTSFERVILHGRELERARSLSEKLRRYNPGYARNARSTMLRIAGVANVESLNALSVIAGVVVRARVREGKLTRSERSSLSPYLHPSDYEGSLDEYAGIMASVAHFTGLRFDRDSVLLIDPGNGAIGVFVKRECGSKEVFGLTSNPIVAKYALRSGELMFTTGSAAKMPFPKKYFDIVIIPHDFTSRWRLSLLTANPEAFTDAVMREAYRVLRPGGFVFAEGSKIKASVERLARASENKPFRHWEEFSESFVNHYEVTAPGLSGPVYVLQK